MFGYGIVTGLDGQGDSRIEYTELGILNALERLGIRADKADKSRNIAAVMVTANIGPFAKEGSRMDVTVSSIGNADSLQGGCRKPTSGADGVLSSHKDLFLLEVCRLETLAERVYSQSSTVGIISNKNS